MNDMILMLGLERKVEELESENAWLRGMLEECKPYLRDFRTKHEVLAQNTTEGTDLRGWYVSEYRKADDLLGRM